MPNFKIQIDKLDSVDFVGWVIDKDNLSESVELELLINDEVVNSTQANILRKALKQKKQHNTGKAGFKFNLKNYDISKSSQVSLKSKNIILPGSPYSIIDLGQNDKPIIKNRILIAGLNKSGTSILAFRVAAGLDTKNIYFEPNGINCFTNLDAHLMASEKEKVVTKVLFHPGVKHRIKKIVNLYDKSIWIYRDPRDVLISAFLYTWHKGHNPNPELFKKALDLVRRKEENPSSISFFELMEGFYSVPNFLKKNYESLIHVLERFGDNFFKLRYEDFIDENIDSLNEYLGFKIDHNAEVSEKFKRVSRSRKYGNWKHWFTNADIIKAKELFNPILAQLGYDTNDWSLDPNPKIESKTGSEYMLKLFDSTLVS